MTANKTPEAIAAEKIAELINHETDGKAISTVAIQTATESFASFITEALKEERAIAVESIKNLVAVIDTLGAEHAETKAELPTVLERHEAQLQAYRNLVKSPPEYEALLERHDRMAAFIFRERSDGSLSEYGLCDEDMCIYDWLTEAVERHEKNNAS